MDIRKPEFMKQAITSKSHGIVFQLLVTVALYFVGSIVGMIIQFPATMIYLFRDKEYLRMITTMDINMDKMVEIVSNQPAWMTIVSLIAQLGLIVAVLLYCRFLEKRKPRTLGFRKKGFVIEYGKGIAVGAVAFLATVGICMLFGALSVNAETVKEYSVLYIIGFFLGYMVQGMAEEVLCRGFFLVSLTKRYGVKASVITSSLLFMVLHGMNPGMTFLSNVNLFLFGCVMALLFIRCENIWLIGAVHSVWNFVQGNIFGMQVSGLGLQPSIFRTVIEKDMAWMNGGAFGMEGGLATTLVLLAGGAIILLDMKKKNYFVKAEPVSNPYDEEALKQAMEQLERTANRYGNQGMNPKPPYGNDASQSSNQVHSQWTGTDGEEKTETVRENMGCNAGETPWHPQTETEETDVYTGFDENYFRNEKEE